jgi:hypothetical protein
MLFDLTVRFDLIYLFTYLFRHSLLRGTSVSVTSHIHIISIQLDWILKPLIAFNVNALSFLGESVVYASLGQNKIVLSRKMIYASLTQNKILSQKKIYASLTQNKILSQKMIYASLIQNKIVLSQKMI